MRYEFTWRVAREGWPFVGILLAVAGVAWLVLGLPRVSIAATVAAVLVAGFFRDPERSVPGEPGLVVSPADGRVVRTVAESPGEGASVSIFLSIFNVHVNRIPIGGTVVREEYTKGRFRAAFRSEASLENERMSIAIETPAGIVECVQIAGLVARRIVCRVRKGDRVVTGQRYGLIRFGSRADVRLPKGVPLLVEVGDRVRGGVTPLARIEAAP